MRSRTGELLAHLGEPFHEHRRAVALVRRHGLQQIDRAIEVAIDRSPRGREVEVPDLRERFVRHRR
jgi:hypothetical protein